MEVVLAQGDDNAVAKVGVLVKNEAEITEESTVLATEDKPANEMKYV